MGNVKNTITDNDFQITELYGIETTAQISKMVICKSQPLLVLPRTELSLTALKLFDIYLARINPKDPLVTKVIFTKSELCKILGVEKINNKELNGALKSLRECQFKIETDKTITLNGLLSTAYITYKDEQYDGIAAIVLICNDKIKSLIYNVGSVGYIKMKLSEVLSFEGRNTYSLYQYLCQNLFRGHWIADITELKSYMGIDEKYKLFQNFERRVLIPCKKEIEEKTDLRFNYKKIRSGRKIKKLSFQIVKKAVVEEQQETEFDDDTLPFAQNGDKVSLSGYRFDDIDDGIIPFSAYDEPSKNDGFDEIQFCFDDDDIDMPPFN